MPDLAIATTAALIAGILFSVMSASFFFRTFLRVREKFPVVFKEGYVMSYLVDAYVWDPLVPSTVRREYFLYLSCAVVAGGSFASLFILDESPVPAVLFGAVSALGVIQTLIRWVKYRDRL
jgi:hypothetical protein